MCGCEFCGQLRLLIESLAVVHEIMTYRSEILLVTSYQHLQNGKRTGVLCARTRFVVTIEHFCHSLLVAAIDS